MSAASAPTAYRCEHGVCVDHSHQTLHELIAVDFDRLADETHKPSAITVPRSLSTDVRHLLDGETDRRPGYISSLTSLTGFANVAPNQGPPGAALPGKLRSTRVLSYRDRCLK
jgi:hypothetical protein